MSLPDVPNTLREKYYSVMAGQNDADILPDIETAPSTENRYLDYIARNGGGGGGDVTKAYVDEQDAKKTDKVTSAISGNFAGLDSNGNLTDSGKTATDFATASDMSDVQGVIPSTATTSNKLATAADVTGEDISATSTTSPLTDSADGYVQGVTVKGHSEVVDGAIKSIGDAGWGVVDLGTLEWVKYDGSIFYVSFAAMANNKGGICAKYEAVLYYSSLLSHDKCFVKDANGYLYIKDTEYENSDATTFKSAMSGVLLYYPLADTTGATPIFGITSKDGEGQGTAATITTGLPLRSVSDSIYDTLDNEKVVKKCAEVTPESNWSYMSSAAVWKVVATGIIKPATTQSSPVDIICNKNYQKTTWAELGGTDKRYAISPDGEIGIYDIDYGSGATIDIYIVYPLATPTETPLTSAEKSALASLRTYDHTTHIDATDAPTMTVDYLLNTNNGKAVAGIQTDLQGQIDDLGGGGSTSPVKMISWTGTGATSNTVVFPDKPKAIVGIWGEGTSNDDSIVWIGQCFGKGQKYPYNWVSGSQPGTSYSNVSWNTEANSMTLSHTEAAGCANKNGAIYYCLYI